MHLLVADNIDVTDSGLIRRRARRLQRCLGGAWHSVWRRPRRLRCAQRSDLVRIESSAASSTVVVASVGDAPVSFASAGWVCVHWSNGFPDRPVGWRRGDAGCHRHRTLCL